MRKYTIASCSLGSFVNEKMEQSMRKSRIRRLELTGSLCTREEDDAVETVRRLQSMVQDGSWVIGSVHIPFGEPYDPSAADETARLANCERIREVVMKCVDAGLGAPAYTLHGGMEPTTDEERSLRLAQSRKSLAELAPFFKELGAYVNVEFLPRSCCGNCVEELQFITDGQPDNVGICFDVNHVMDHSRDLPRWITALAPRIRSFHLSDYDGVDEQHWLIPHQGVIDWHGVMAAIKAIDHDVNMIFECNFRGGVTWRGNTCLDSTPRIFEYSAFYLENVERFKELDDEFENCTF